MLYVVATPIGNLEDVTLRALEILRRVDLVACEDTRQTGKLLNRYQINTRLISYYEHNKIARGKQLLDWLKEGKDIAVVSDSGTPGISDPGFHLVKLALESGISVSPAPGASAIIAALSVSGIPADRFVFEGFLPQKTGPRKKKLLQLFSYKKTIVLYESPHRFMKLLLQLAEISSDIELAVVREISKKFEEIKTGCIGDILEYFRDQRIRGEFVVVIKALSRQALTKNETSHECS